MPGTDVFSCLRVLRGILLACVLVIGCVGHAEAHAVLEQVQPPDRSILAVAPQAFSLQFDEPVGVTDLRLLDEAGRALAIKTQADDALVHADIVDPLPPGSYTIAYHVISADGHPVAGALQFQVGDGQTRWRVADDGLAWWQWGKMICLLSLYLAGFSFWGGCFAALRRKDNASASVGSGSSRGAITSSVIVLCAACLLVGFQAAGMTGSTPAQMLSGTGWTGAGGTSDGRIALLFIVALATGWLALSLQARGHLAGGLTLISGACMVLSLSTAGHVAVLGWPQIIVLTFHVACALIWTRSLQPLLRRLRQTGGATRPVRSRRRAGLWIVLGAGISGAGLACWQIVEPRLLVSTPYGFVLAAKIIAVIGLIALSAINRRLAGREGISARLLRFWIGGQIGCLIVVLGLTAALGQLIPPRHLLTVPARPESGSADRLVAEKMLHANDAMALIRLIQRPDGRYQVDVRLSSMSESSLVPRHMALAFSNLDAKIGPLTRDLQEQEAVGVYLSSPLDLVPVGRWQIDVAADLDDFDRRHFVLVVILPAGTIVP